MLTYAVPRQLRLVALTIHRDLNRSDPKYTAIDLVR